MTFSELSWKILEAKILYYDPVAELASLPMLSDAEYDNLEVEYLKRCKAEGHVNYLVHKQYPGFEDVGFDKACMEVDWNRPSSAVALNRLYIKANVDVQFRRSFGPWAPWKGVKSGL